MDAPYYCAPITCAPPPQAFGEQAKLLADMRMFLHSLFVGIKAGIHTLSQFGNARPSAPIRAAGGAMGAMTVAPIPQMGLKEEELRTLQSLMTAGLPLLRFFGVTQDGHEEYDAFADITSVMIVRVVLYMGAVGSCRNL